MHSKRKGNIGSFGIGLELAKLGYSVFTEQGDISKIDIIAEKNSQLIRIQCKAITPTNNSLKLELTKSGPNYKFKYESKSFDYFGIWDLVNNKAYLIPSSILDNYNQTFTIRLVKSKNNQDIGINIADDYELEKMLSCVKYI